MRSRLKLNKGGFTIIEVMIVLAIAGLILLIVFLAVPALQRSERNTGRKEDAGRLVTAFQDFISNSSGNLPKTTSDCQSILSDAGTLNQYKGLQCVSSLSGPNQMAIIISSGSGGKMLSTPTGNELEFVEGATCSGTSSYNSSSSQQQTALFYSLESGGGNYQWACENA